jgi:hypothetical protein
MENLTTLTRNYCVARRQVCNTEYIYIYICICRRQWKSNHFNFFLSEPAHIAPCGYISPHYMPHEVSFKIVCPTEEESGMLMSSLPVKCSHVRMGSKKGDVQGQARDQAGLKNRAMGPVRVEVHSFVQNTSKRALIIFLGTVFLYHIWHYYHCTRHKLPCISNTFSPIQVIKKPNLTETRNMHLFLIGSYLVQLQIGLTN